MRLSELHKGDVFVFENRRYRFIERKHHGYRYEGLTWDGTSTIGLSYLTYTDESVES